MVVLSDDEEDDSEVQVLTVKTEPSELSDNNDVIAIDKPPDCIDLTDEIFEDAEVPTHYISWLDDLVRRATIKPSTSDEEASTSGDVIVIDEPYEKSDKEIVESQANKVQLEFYWFSPISANSLQ